MGDLLPQRKKRGRKAAPIHVIDGVQAKICSRCGIMQPLTNYPPKGRTGRLHARCRECFYATAAESRQRQLNGTAKRLGPNLKLRKERYVNGAREKWCNHCKAFLAEAAFAKNRSRYDGLHPYCLACNRAKQAAERARRGEDYREMRRRYRKTESGKRAYNRYRKVFPHKVEAQKLAQLAVRRGELVKPKVCGECGRGGTIDAHHDDYLKPLAVRWLCRWCHQEWHRINGEARNAYPGHAGPISQIARA